MYWRSHQITRAVRKYDRELYARLGHEGRIDIFRRGFGYEPYELDNGITIMKLIDVPYRAFCLTDTWNAWGKPVDWGIEPILLKLRKSDLWHRDIAHDVNAQNEKIDKAHERDFHNETEAFLKDARRAMARKWDDINTSTLDKRNDRRYRHERKLKI